MNYTIRKASQELRNMWVVGNEYLQKAQPWSILKKDENKAKSKKDIRMSKFRMVLAAEIDKKA